jgi:hypothetical protein
LPNHPIKPLAGGAINQFGDTLSVELVEPADAPPAVLIRWPAAPTITTAARYNEVASTAMKLLTEASTTLARIKAGKRL